MTPKRFPAVGLLLVVVVIVCSGIFHVADRVRTRHIHFVVPAGYRGIFKLCLDREHGQRITKTGGRYVVNVPPDGVVLVSSDDLFFGLSIQTAQYLDGSPLGTGVATSEPEGLDTGPPALRCLFTTSHECWFLVGTADEERLTWGLGPSRLRPGPLGDASTAP